MKTNFLEEKQKDLAEIRRLANKSIANRMEVVDKMQIVVVQQEKSRLEAAEYWEDVGKLLKEKDESIEELGEKLDSEIKRNRIFEKQID